MEHLLVELSETFVKLHKNQLERNGIPEYYWNTLCTKLKDEVKKRKKFFFSVKCIIF